MNETIHRRHRKNYRHAQYGDPTFRRWMIGFIILPFAVYILSFLPHAALLMAVLFAVSVSLFAYRLRHEEGRHVSDGLDDPPPTPRRVQAPVLVSRSTPPVLTLVPEPLPVRPLHVVPSDSVTGLSWPTPWSLSNLIIHQVVLRFVTDMVFLYLGYGPQTPEERFYDPRLEYPDHYWWMEPTA